MLFSSRVHLCRVVPPTWILLTAAITATSRLLLWETFVATTAAAATTATLMVCTPHITAIGAIPLLLMVVEATS